jgi:hypothetical protein
MWKKKGRIWLHLPPSSCNVPDVSERRDPREVIAPAIAAADEGIVGVEKAAGLRRGELQSYLNGSDIDARALVAACGLLGFSPADLFKEVAA